MQYNRIIQVQKEVNVVIDAKTGLYFETSGSSDAPSIVFLHGGGAGGWMWRRQVELLSSEYHCLVPDLPEQGKSIHIRPFSVDFAADCIAELIRAHAHGGKAHVVGLSEGAQILISLLSRHPEVINHAVASSANLRPMPGHRLYTSRLFSFTYRWFIAPFKNTNWWIRLNMHGSAGIGDEYFSDFKNSFQQITESGFTNLMLASMNFRLPAGLDKVNIPVLVVTGKREYKQMRQSAADLLAVLPNSKGVWVSFGKGSSLSKEHNWALTAPELFAATVKAWIEDRPLPDALLRLG